MYIRKTLYKIKAYRTRYQTIPTILKRNKLSNFSRLLNASARITWMCPSVSGPKAFKKTCLRFAIFNFKWKVTEHFRNRIKQIWSVLTKIALIEKIFRKKKFADSFFVYVLMYPLSKFGGNRTYSLWILAF